MSELIKLAIYAAIAAALYFFCMTAWHHFTGNYKAEGAALQLAADKPIIEGITKERDQWHAEELKREDEAKGLNAKLGIQSAQIHALGVRADKAIARTAAVEIEQAKRTAHSASIDARDQQIIITPQPQQSADTELKETDSIIREALGFRKGAVTEDVK